MTNYEKKYNEALLRADEAVQKGCLDKDMFDIIFPPEETEDEKIRKDLIADLQTLPLQGVLTHRPTSEYIAYLEKQEQKPSWTEEEMKALDSIIDDYEKVAKSFCGYDGKIGLLKAIRDGEYDLSKKEWSEEDEKMIERLITRLNWITYNTRTNGTSPNITFFDEIDWLKSLRPSWKPSDQDELMKLKYAGTSTKLD